MRLKICPHCRNRLNEHLNRCECGYDFKQMKVIPFGNEEEAKAFLLEEEKDLIWKARDLAKKTMLLGIGLIVLGMLSFILAVTANLHKFTFGALVFGIIFLVKGCINYFTKEVDDDLDFKL